MSNVPYDKTPIATGSESGIDWAVMPAPRYGAANGYAKLPEGHPWSDVDPYGSDSPSVHGGVTYAKGDWIGFDTMHAWDVWPEMEEQFYRDGHEIYWSVDMVVEEAKSLARQVAARAGVGDYQI